MTIVTPAQVTISKAVVTAAITGTTSSASNSSSSSSSSTQSSVTGLASNFNQFLTLLTTQLQNQDPTSPMDTDQFTQQLVEFSQVEQQIQTNQKLDTLISNTGGNQLTSLLGYVGMNATVNSPSSTLANGSASWLLNSPQAVTSANITISDANGNQVASFTQQLGAGTQSISWNGQTSSGTTAPNGVYKIAVTAQNSGGAAVTVTPEINTVITGIDSSSGTAMLTAGGLSFTPSQVLTISTASASSS
jgi:flagellar basal-body rod modification protein FlgD